MKVYVYELTKDLLLVFSFNLCIVTDIKIRPEITQSPENNFVNLFNRVVLKCIAIGQPTPVLTWQKDGQDIGVIGENLVLQEVTLADRANYTCTAKNPYGTAVSRSAIVNTLG